MTSHGYQGVGHDGNAREMKRVCRAVDGPRQVVSGPSSRREAGCHPEEPEPLCHPKERQRPLVIPTER